MIEQKNFKDKRFNNGNKKGKMKLKNKVVVVTGGSSGIGKAISSLFSKQGAKIIIVGLDSKKGDEVVKKIKNSIFVKTNISKHGKIDILINNAGIGSDKDFEKSTKKDWTKILNTNLIGTFLCTQKASKYMKGGTIINISSAAGLNYNTSVSRPDYSVSKAGVINLTKSTAKKLAPKIRVNCIAPGYIDAGLNIGMKESKRRQIIKKTPLKRLGKAEEIAKIALFLASDESSFITGEVIVVDGGISI